MSSSIFPAFNGLTLQPNSTTDVAVEGLVTQRAVYIGSLATINSLNWGYGLQHPSFAYVGLETFRIISKKAGVGQIELTYKGAFSFSQPYYSCHRSITTIPVAKADNFSTVATEANGAVFDDNGIFLGWSKTSPYAGLTSLDAPVISITQTSMSDVPNQGGTPGEVSSAPGPYSSGQAIFMGASVTQQGGVCYRNSLTWQTVPSASIPPLP
jgi:hypothetical protein